MAIITPPQDDVIQPPADVIAQALNASAVWVGWRTPPSLSTPTVDDELTYHVRLRLHDDMRSLFGLGDSGSVIAV